MGKSAFKTNITIFFLGEYFSDALRNTFAVVLPIALFFYLGKSDTATGIGVGALLISLADLPDHRANKLKAAIYSIGLFFLSALLISSTVAYPNVAAGVLIGLAFVFSMFNGLGNRMGLIGTMSLALCTFVLGLHPINPFQFSCYILLGGCWYHMLSLIQVLLRPYRALHHAIFECLISSAAFLRSRAAHYNPDVPLISLQPSSIRLHIRVNQRHELIRQLLLTDDYAMNPDNQKGRNLLNKAGLVIDLYEQLSAVHYDYQYVRETLSDTGSLTLIEELIESLALELEILSRDFRKPQKDQHDFRKNVYLDQKERLLSLTSGLSIIQQNIISRIIDNADAIMILIEKMSVNTTPASKPKSIENEIVYPLFVTSENTSFWKQFSLSSPVFRFSLRLALSFLFAYLLLQFFEPGKYSYWIFLTLLIVSRPKFSLTWRKNVQRVLGTLSGVAFGLVLVYLIKSPIFLLSLSVVFLLCFYAFNRLNYAVCVVFITAAVILTLGSYHGHFDHIILERIIYTFLGCAIAILATYLFPVWDSRKVEHYISHTIALTQDYLNVAVGRANNALADETQLRMARKNAHLSLVELSDAIGSAKLEPISGRIDFSSLQVIQFTIYQIGALATSIFLSREDQTIHPQLQAINLIFTGIRDGETSSQMVMPDAYRNIPGHDDGTSSVDHKLNEILKLSLSLSDAIVQFKNPVA